MDECVKIVRHNAYDCFCSDVHVQRAPTRCFDKSRPLPENVHNEEDASTTSEEDEEEEQWECLGARSKRHQQQRDLRENQLKKKKEEKENQKEHASKRRSADHTARSTFDHESSFHDSQKHKIDEVHREPPLIAAIKGVGDGNSRNDVQARFESMRQVIHNCPQAVQEKDHYGQTPLFWAIGLHEIDALKFLVESRADISAMNKFGYTPLMRAIAHGRIDMAEELMRAQADLAAKDKFKSTALHIAASSKSSQCDETLRWLLACQVGQNMLHQVDADGLTPLFVAVQSGRTATACVLLEAGAQGDCPDHTGRTPLLLALARNDVDLAGRLVACSADVNACDEHGRSLLITLIDHLRKRTVSGKETMLCGIATLLELRATVDIRNRKGKTAFFLAAECNEQMACVVLGAYGADVTTCDDTERSAGKIAQRLGYTQIVKVIQDFGSLRAKGSVFLDKALLRATYYGSMDACQKLLDRAANCMATTKGGRSTMEIARRVGHDKIAEVLTKVGVEMRVMKEYEKTLAAQDTSNTLSELVEHVRGVGQQAQRIQASIRAGEMNVAVKHVLALLNSTPTTKASSASVTLLEEFWTLRRDNLLSQAHVSLRSMRMHHRMKCLLELREELRVFHASGVCDANQLQALATSGSSRVSACCATDWENTDAHTKRNEEFTQQIILPVLQLCADVHVFVAEEEQAYKVFPPPVDQLEALFEERQCKHCLVMFPTVKVLEEHQNKCKSSLGKKKIQERKEGRRREAESGVRRLEDAAMMYRQRATECEEVGKQLNTLKKKLSKEAPEILALASTCQSLLRALVDICGTRAKTATRESGKASQKFFKGRLHSNMGCLVCLCMPAQVLTVHEEKDVEPHLCLCTSCAFALDTALKQGKTQLCPVCDKSLSGIMKGG